jgi:hypothetical protein
MGLVFGSDLRRCVVDPDHLRVGDVVVVKTRCGVLLPSPLLVPSPHVCLDGHVAIGCAARVVTYSSGAVVGRSARGIPFVRLIFLSPDGRYILWSSSSVDVELPVALVAGVLFESVS